MRYSLADVQPQPIMHLSLTACGSSKGWKPVTSASTASRLSPVRRVILVSSRCSIQPGHASSGEASSASSSDSSDGSSSSSSAAAAEAWLYVAPAHVLDRRQQLREQLHGKVILAPLTKGTFIFWACAATSCCPHNSADISISAADVALCARCQQEFNLAPACNAAENGQSDSYNMCYIAHVLQEATCRSGGCAATLTRSCPPCQRWPLHASSSSECCCCCCKRGPTRTQQLG
jgi:hypothetical protein